MNTLLGIIGFVVILAAIYFAAGTIICWLVSWAGDEKMSFNGVTIRTILTWPKLFIKKPKML